MIALIQPAPASGQLTAPASKSAMQRACAAALLRRGTTRLLNPGRSADDTAALGIIRSLGAEVEAEDEALVIRSDFPRSAHTGSLYCGESGLSIRMFTPIAALLSGPVAIEGSGSLRVRPMDFFEAVLPQLGVQVQTAGGRLPLQVRGPLQPASIEVDGSLSSQFLTGLLMAYAGAGARDVTIHVKGLTSRPYIDLTLELMAAFGLPLPTNEGYERFHFPDGAAPVAPAATLTYAVEGDWSGAAFPLVAGALGGPVDVTGLHPRSVQADRAVLEAIRASGAGLQETGGTYRVDGGDLAAFTFNAVDCPDLFPPLAALASGCMGTSVITGVHRLKHKESDRAITLQEELGKLGIRVTLEGDDMRIEGGPVSGGEVSSRGDHRIAMACAVAATRAAGPVRITGAEAVNKSYPDFWKHLLRLGITVSIND